MTFEGNITAHLNSTAFSERMGEEMKIYGTNGAIYLIDEEIYVEPLGEKAQKISVELPIGGYANHSGGDVGIIKAFVEYLETGNMPFNLTSIDVSVRSHEICFLAQESSENGGKVLFFK
jgi:predicted dehydrogenase